MQGTARTAKADITVARIIEATGITTVVKIKSAVVTESGRVSSESIFLFGSVKLGFLFAF